MIAAPASNLIVPAFPTAAAPSSLDLIKVGFVILFSTTPGVGEAAALPLTALGLLWLLFSMPVPARGAVMLFALLILLILPISLYDLWASLDQGFSTLSFIGIPVYLFGGFILSQSVKGSSYIAVYERAFFYLSAASFALFALFVIVPSIAYLLPEYTFRETTHRTAIILNVLMNPDPVIRNAGFASEPGFYQLLANAALYARLRLVGRPDKTCLFYLVVVVSTVSSTGIVVALLLVSVRFDIRYRLFLFLLVILFFGTAQEFITAQYEAKVVNDAVFGPRFIPSLNAFQLFLEEPLGIGAVEYTRIYQGLDVGSWDSYTQIAMRYGVPGLIALAALLTSLGRRHLALTGVFMLSFVTSPIWFVPAVCAFYFPGRHDDGTETQASESGK